MENVTQILGRIERGDIQSSEQLLPIVYEELRRLAQAKLADERPGQTLQPTALVHEAYLRLVDVEQAQHWNSRWHFLAAAAEAMRRILVEAARHKQSWKAGGKATRVEMQPEHAVTPGQDLDLVALDEALQLLGEQAPRKAELVKLRYFAGLTIAEAAAALEISPSTADADWAYAKAWLRQKLGS